ncbi:diguanylate cyclase [Aquisalimonas sp.]|uniref:sensor domain-containing diguanylate cyclase n=1 Tax=unclassified Aquisalimonas TaxID=2644645 RepID=UPI0025BAB319|nr:diguanylate cyclase [Aquisalimonas sp.]
MTHDRRHDSSHPLAAIGIDDAWQFIRDLWKHFPENMFVIRVADNGDFLVEAVNPAQEAMLNLPPGACIGKRIDELMPEPGCWDVIARYRRCVERGEPMRYEERGVYDGMDGTPQDGYWITLLMPIRARDGVIRHLFGISQDVTDIHRARLALEQQNERLEQRVIERTRELEALNRQLEEQANRDGLTHAFNRRYLYEAAAGEYERARRYGTGLSAVMLDVDEFKTFNDERGHHYGDMVLVDLVRTAQEDLRSSDRLGRVGGDEFMILLPEADLGRAHATAERIREAVSARALCSVSLGVAELAPSDTTVDAVFHRADAALRHAKRNGRGRTSALPAAHASPESG